MEKVKQFLTILLKNRKTVNIVVGLVVILAFLPWIRTKLQEEAINYQSLDYFCILALGLLFIVCGVFVRFNIILPALNYAMVVILCWFMGINPWLGLFCGTSSLCIGWWINREPRSLLKLYAVFAYALGLGIALFTSMFHDDVKEEYDGYKAATQQPQVILIDCREDAAYTKEYGLVLNISWLEDPRPGDRVRMKFNQDSTKVWAVKVE